MNGIAAMRSITWRTVTLVYYTKAQMCRKDGLKSTASVTKRRPCKEDKVQTINVPSIKLIKSQEKRHPYDLQQSLPAQVHWIISLFTFC